MGQKVLLVDDELDILETLRLVLAPVCEALQASNGGDALRLIETEQPSLVLLDVSMPEMDGLDVLKAARRLFPSLAVVMLTGEEDLAVAKRALEAGARAYITKPFDPQALREEIRRMLQDLTAQKEPYRPWRVAQC